MYISRELSKVERVARPSNLHPCHHSSASGVDLGNQVGAHCTSCRRLREGVTTYCLTASTRPRASDHLVFGLNSKWMPTAEHSRCDHRLVS